MPPWLLYLGLPSSASLRFNTEQKWRLSWRDGSSSQLPGTALRGTARLRDLNCIELLCQLNSIESISCRLIRLSCVKSLHICVGIGVTCFHFRSRIRVAFQNEGWPARSQSITSGRGAALQDSRTSDFPCLDLGSSWCLCLKMPLWQRSLIVGQDREWYKAKQSTRQQRNL